MQCPIDGTTLLISERHGIEIDYCPKCRGVWLDRGELDKIIDKATAPLELSEPAPAPKPERPIQEARHRATPEDRDTPYEYGRRDRPGKKKRGGFLGELFEEIFD